MPKRQPMNLREWWDHVGEDNAILVIDELGSSLHYFRQLRYGLKVPSEAMAARIVDAAKRITPGWSPDASLLCDGVPRTGRPAKILPSAEFLRSQRRVGR